jgi:ribonuclease-3
VTLTEFQECIGYRFHDDRLLDCALCHSSYANERKDGMPSNERLEFLGDSILGFLAAEYLFFQYRGKPEGELTKLRAAAVCESALASYAGSIRIPETLRMGKGEVRDGAAFRPSIAADAFEAVLAAIFIDGGIEAARAFAIPFLERPIAKTRVTDSKSLLQQVLQQSPDEYPEYRLVGSSGPDHEKIFEVQVMLHSNVLGTGKGRSKKAAEQAAAAEALRLMGIEN